MKLALLVLWCTVLVSVGGCNRSAPVLTKDTSVTWQQRTWAQIEASTPLEVTMADLQAHGFQQPLRFPTTLTSTAEHPDIGTIQIRAFPHDFGWPGLEAVWALGYVAVQDTAHPRLPGPLIVAQAGQTTRVRWENRLAQTIWHNPAYTFPNAEVKWYPLLYVPADTAKRNPMLRAMLYPDTAEWRRPRPADSPAGHMGLEMSRYLSTTVHLHGANLPWHNDGYPSSHYLTLAQPHPHYQAIDFGLFGPLEAQQHVEYEYPNVFPEGRPVSLGNAQLQAFNTSQLAQIGKHGGILWYHDHAMMRTAPNVYLGLTGAYLIKGGSEERTLPAQLAQMPDLPLVICDKRFAAYTDKPGGAKRYYQSYDVTQNILTQAGRLDTTDPARDDAGQPEFFGNTIAVNGTLWPYLAVQRRAYRFRVLNTSSSRFYRLALQYGTQPSGQPVPAGACWQIGTEGGIMPPLLQQEQDSVGPFPRITREHPLILAPGERADIIVDFSVLRRGSADTLTLINLAGDEPYGADANVDSMTSPTNFIMAFRVATAQQLRVASTLPLAHWLQEWQHSQGYQFATTNLLPSEPARLQPTQEAFSRQLRPALVQLLARVPSTYWVDTSPTDAAFHPFRLYLKEARDFTELPRNYRLVMGVTPQMHHLSFPMVLMDSADWNSEARTPSSAANPASIKHVRNGQQEVWEITNTTNDAHPIHIHLNRFQVLGRENLATPGVAEPALRNERGWKDVVLAKPHYKTYLLVQYILSPLERNTGQFVYHCHILEHEDMSMMRRLVVQPNPAVVVPFFYSSAREAILPQHPSPVRRAPMRKR